MKQLKCCVLYVSVSVRMPVLLLLICWCDMCAWVCASVCLWMCNSSLDLYIYDFHCYFQYLKSFILLFCILYEVVLCIVCVCVLHLWWSLSNPYLRSLPVHSHTRSVVHASIHPRGCPSRGVRHETCMLWVKERACMCVCVHQWMVSGNAAQPTNSNIKWKRSAFAFNLWDSIWFH